MDDFAKLKPEERRIYFEGTATARNIQAQIVEKDFWVCWTLQELFRLPTIGGHLIFKGGTSLSKVFKIMERFSEDIDISIDRGFLGFGGANEPEPAPATRKSNDAFRPLSPLVSKKSQANYSPTWNPTSRQKLAVASNGRFARIMMTPINRHCCLNIQRLSPKKHPATFAGR